MKKPKNWTGLFLLLVCLMLVPIIGLVAYIDPYIHYHSPHTDRFYYELEKERYVSDGMIRQYSYDGVIIGNSMTHNFRATQADQLFGGQTLKATSSAATFHEIYGLLQKALRYNPRLRFVIRGLDMRHFDEEPEEMAYDMGPYPTYLYNERLLDDVYYVLNRDILFGSCGEMMLEALRGGATGITSLDDYGAMLWERKIYGKYAVMCRDTFYEMAAQQTLSPVQRERVLANVRLNVTSLASDYPDTQFYCFIAPYSAAWWADCWERGELEVRLELEELLIREILPYENIHLFSWNTLEELTGDLNNYCDQVHYGAWVNDWMLEQMATDTGRLTEENVDDYLAEERARWLNFDFNALFDQEDPPEDPIPEFFRR